LSNTDAAHSRITLFDMNICNLRYGDVCDSIAARVASREPGFVVTPNVDHVCRFHRDPKFRAAYENACLVLADGMPILWSARLFGCPLPEKLSGSDMLPRLSGYAAEQGYSIFLLGAAEGVANEAVSKLLESHPSLRVAGTYSPPLGFEKDPAANDEVLRRLHEAKPDICFVALGSPKQEVWLHENHAKSGVPVMIGVGAAFDFVANRTRRAPVWMQKTGLEWAWRLFQEPRRLARRYLVEDSYFLVLFLRELLRKRRNRANRLGSANG
jgi:N-acetylglucosaminyldiphosphoundecaprenol N-acetyl-beta-D-mannosaminyltransferase